MATIPSEQQERVVGAADGPWLVLAPPGAGKTDVLTRRIIRLLEDTPDEHFRILAVTFTVKAAESMRQRIESRVGAQWRRVVARNWHAFCLDVLRHYGEAIGFPPEPVIVESDDDRLKTLVLGLEDDALRVTDEERWGPFLRECLARISREKRVLRQPDAVPDVRPPGMPIGLRQAYEAYERAMRRHGTFDFDDLPLLTYRLFVERPRLARHYRTLFKYILVDEAQDTSRAQYELLKVLCGSEHRNVMMVADRNQSIHAFAGASTRHLDEFRKDFGAAEIPLSGTFRCAESIVAVANALLRSEPALARDAPEVESETGAAGCVRAWSFADETAEARAVVDEITRLLASGLEPAWLAPGEQAALAPEDVAVLVRNRFVADTLRAELDARRIRYADAGGPRGVFESRGFRFLFYGLRALQAPSDAIGREHLLAQYEGGLDPDLLRGDDLAAVLQRLASDRAVGPVAAELIRSREGILDPDAALRRLADAVPRPEKEEDRETVEKDHELLLGKWQAFRHEEGNGGPTLGGFLARLALAGRSHVEGPGVRVLTVHAAKGLEFRAVFLLGMNEGGFPDYRATGAEQRLEEVRNAYVAVTRASRVLWLSRPRTRRLRSGALKEQRPSSFLGRMGLPVADR